MATRSVARGADDLHGHPAVGALSRAPPCPGRGGGDDRRGPDPEPRDARRQHRQRLAGRRHAAGPARARRVVRAAAPSRGERTVPADAFWPAYRRHGARRPTSCCSGSGSRCAAGREMRFRKVGTRRAQSISKVVMALSWRDGTGRPRPGRVSGSPSGRWRPRRSGPARRRRSSRAGSPTPETADRAAETLAGELAPDRRRPLDRRVPPARGGTGPASAHPRGGRLVTRRATGPAAADGRARSTSRAGSFAADDGAAVRGRAAVPGPAGDGPAVRDGRGAVRRGLARSPTRCRSPSSSS